MCVPRVELVAGGDIEAIFGSIHGQKEKTTETGQEGGARGETMPRNVPCSKTSRVASTQFRR